MIHNSSGLVIGTADDMHELGDVLGKVDQSLVSILTLDDVKERERIEKIAARTNPCHGSAFGHELFTQISNAGFLTQRINSPRFVLTRKSGQSISRDEARSMLLGYAAEQISEVIEFRKKYLNGKVIDAGKVEEWLGCNA